VEEACRRLFPEPEFPFEEDKDELRDG